MLIGVIFGGESFEHEISIVSAITVKSRINEDLQFVFCDKNREFYLIEDKNMYAKYFSSMSYKKSKKLTLKNGGFSIPGVFGEEFLKCECYINLIHGADGEDGKIAGIFDFFEIPYIGPRLEASVMSYNKELTKLLAQKAYVKVLPYEVLNKSSLPTLPYPFILKPLRLGSSIGISVVRDQSELEYAMEVAFEFDDEVIIEPYYEGVKEFNLAGCMVDGEMKYSIIEEPKKTKMLDFDQKYKKEGEQTPIIEANIGYSLKSDMKDAFYRIYNCGFEGSLIRCDFFEIDGEVYLNEINPNPGSLASHLFDSYEFSEIIRKMAKNPPKSRKIDVEYRFIEQLTSNK